MREFAHSLTIAAPPDAVLDAFFDDGTLVAWCGVVRSRCVPRPLGAYTLEWPATEWRDDVLGRLGGTLRGTVMDFVAGRECFVADAYWLPPDGEPLGPMAIEIACAPHEGGTRLRVRQSGWEASLRWSRYYEVLATGLTGALRELRTYLEAGVRQPVLVREPGERPT